MHDLQLLIGNKNYSSWSLRAWLLLKTFNISFTENQIWLGQDDTASELAQYSPNKLVPVLKHNDLVVHDSLAICEYINEQLLQNRAWPAAIKQRAMARSICCEMHSGFFNIRNNMPMNCRRQITGFIPNQATRIEIERIFEIWQQCLEQSKSQWLFDQFSIADIFYAPIASRLISYQIELPEFANEYCQQLLTLPAMEIWYQQAKQEPHTIQAAEVQL